VVSTAITDVTRLYGDCVAVAHSTAEFVIACHAALAESPASKQQRLERSRATVRASSWDNAAARIRQLMAQAAVRRERSTSPLPRPQAAEARNGGGAGTLAGAPLEAAK
jgi:hypothetical protein